MLSLTLFPALSLHSLQLRRVLAAAQASRPQRLAHRLTYSMFAMVIPAVLQPWPGRRMVNVSLPQAMTRRYVYGTQQLEIICAPINALTWSPDSKRLASASDDKTVQLWDATTGNLIFTYYGHNGQVNTVVWS